MPVQRSVAKLRGAFNNEGNQKKMMINWRKLLISLYIEASIKNDR